MKNLSPKITFACLLVIGSLAAAAFAVDPPPDGGYPNENTAEGDNSLLLLTSGADNTAIGFNALYNNTTGIQNTAVGSFALTANTVGYNNTAVGKTALQSNTTAIDGVAIGVAALQLNSTGNFNVAVGLSALTLNTTGTLNTALGTSALYYNNGNSNTALGTNALTYNRSGGSNTAAGHQALYNTTGSGNIGVGDMAGVNLTTGNNNIDLGNAGAAAETNTIRVGTQGTQTATYFAGIRGTPITGGLAVGITADGQLGVRASSARFKEAIKPMDKASEAILSLRPVSFRYRKELDPKSEPQFGLIAEEVAKVDPDLVVIDTKGQSFSVRYEEVNAMLLNEFLKEHRKVESLETTVAQQRDDFRSAFAQQKDLRSTVAQQQRQIDALRSQMQTVSDQRAASQTAPPLLVKSR